MINYSQLLICIQVSSDTLKYKYTTKDLLDVYVNLICKYNL